MLFSQTDDTPVVELKNKSLGGSAIRMSKSKSGRDNVVDLSGDPMKYFGIFGELLEVTGLAIPTGKSKDDFRICS